MDGEFIWSPPEWACCCFPVPDEDQEVQSMDYIVGVLQNHLNKVTEADTTALGRALHVGHMLVTMQSESGDWPAVLNLRTGERIGDERSLEPVPLFQRMTEMVGTSEFDHVLQRAASSK